MSDRSAYEDRTGERAERPPPDNPLKEWMRLNALLMETARKAWSAPFAAFSQFVAPGQKKSEKDEKIDEAIKETFPASDPPGYNPGTARPSDDSPESEDRSKGGK